MDSWIEARIEELKFEFQSSFLYSLTHLVQQKKYLIRFKLWKRALPGLGGEAYRVISRLPQKGEVPRVLEKFFSINSHFNLTSCQRRRHYKSTYAQIPLGKISSISSSLPSPAMGVL